MPPFGVAPICAVSMSESHRRWASIWRFCKARAPGEEKDMDGWNKPALGPTEGRTRVSGHDDDRGSSPGFALEPISARLRQLEREGSEGGDGRMGVGGKH